MKFMKLVWKKTVSLWNIYVKQTEMFNFKYSRSFKITRWTIVRNSGKKERRISRFCTGCVKKPSLVIPIRVKTYFTSYNKPMQWKTFFRATNINLSLTKEIKIKKPTRGKKLSLQEFEATSKKLYESFHSNKLKYWNI